MSNGFFTKKIKILPNNHKDSELENEMRLFYNNYDNTATDDFFSDKFTGNEYNLSPAKAQESLPENEIKEWFTSDFEGQLSVDVFDTNDAIIIKSAMAGVDPEDLDIFIDNDMLTIRGKRESGVNIKDEDYYFQECYWGGFSRSILLPTDVKFEEIKASLKNGVLTVILPKTDKKKKIDIEFED